MHVNVSVHVVGVLVPESFVTSWSRTYMVLNIHGDTHDPLLVIYVHGHVHT